MRFLWALFLGLCSFMKTEGFHDGFIYSQKSGLFVRKIIPVFFISVVLLGLAIILSLMWGLKGAAFIPSSMQFGTAHASFWKDFGYFWDDLVRHLQTGIGKILLQLLIIFPAAFLMGQLARRLGQPSVIGHILAGVLLGPSVFGNVLPDAAQFLFAEDQGLVLHMLGALGVMLFMFLAGMEMDFKLLRNQTNAVIMVSHVGIFFPFFLGVQAASWIYRSYGADTHFFSFALMMVYCFGLRVCCGTVYARKVDGGENILSKQPPS